MSNNIIEPLVDSALDVLKVLGEGITTLLGIEKHVDIEEFFKKAGLKNSEGEYPKFKNREKVDSSVWEYFSLPQGLSTADFEKHKLALEQSLIKDIEIVYDYNIKQVIIKLNDRVR